MAVIGIIGLGLIGSSFARAIKHYKAPYALYGFDQVSEVAEQAFREQIIDHYFLDIGTLAHSSTIILLATPLHTYPDLFKEIAPSLLPGTIVTDVGSVKHWVQQLAETYLPAHCHWIPGHPIAGSEQSGLAAGKAELFLGKKVILTPTQLSEHSAAFLELTSLWHICGAQVESMSPEKHDAIYAYVSHLVQLLCYLFAYFLKRSGYTPCDIQIEIEQNKVFAEFTRLAHSSIKLWEDIFLLNIHALLSAISIYQTRLEWVINLLENQQYSHLLDHYNLQIQRRCSLTEKPIFYPSPKRHLPSLYSRMLPHILAATLIENCPWLSYSGSGFSSYTAPLLDSPLSLAELSTGQAELRDAIKGFYEEIAMFKTLLEQKDALSIHSFLQKAILVKS